MNRVVCINLSAQQLALWRDGQQLETHLISTALNGAGVAMGSFKTPLGRHVVAEKIGAGLPSGAVFKSRRPTGEVHASLLDRLRPNGADWILTRILWLTGLDADNATTYERYIYIHGCPDSAPMGVPLSHGCIRMRNQALIRLFDAIDVGDQVLIES